MRTRKHQPYTALKLALAGKGLTYKEVAAVIGVTVTTLMLKINGESDFYLSEQRLICETFGIDPAVFFADKVA